MKKIKLSRADLDKCIRVDPSWMTKNYNQFILSHDGYGVTVSGPARLVDRLLAIKNGVRTSFNSVCEECDA